MLSKRCQSSHRWRTVRKAGAGILAVALNDWFNLQTGATLIQINGIAFAILSSFENPESQVHRPGRIRLEFPFTKQLQRNTVTL